MVNKMAGSNDVIYVQGIGKIFQIILDMKLKTKLHPYIDQDLVAVFLAQLS